VPLMPDCVPCSESNIQNHRNSKCSPLAENTAMEAKSRGVLNFRVSAVGFGPHHRCLSAFIGGEIPAMPRTVAVTMDTRNFNRR
jgi:hypothetical protein